MELNWTLVDFRLTRVRIGIGEIRGRRALWDKISASWLCFVYSRVCINQNETTREKLTKIHQHNSLETRCVFTSLLLGGMQGPGYIGRFKMSQSSQNIPIQSMFPGISWSSCSLNSSGRSKRFQRMFEHKRSMNNIASLMRWPLRRYRFFWVESRDSHT